MDSKEILGMLEDSRRALDDVLAKDALEEGRRGALYELGQNYEALQKELRRTEAVLAAVRAGAAEREAKIAILADAAAERTEEAEAANTKLDNTRSLLEKQDARVNRLSDELGAANARAEDWKAAHERAAVIASDALDKQRAELEAQLAEARAEIESATANWRNTSRTAWERNGRLEKEASRLRAALEHVKEFAGKLWPWANARRCQLIEAKRYNYCLSDKQRAELEDLQALADENINIFAPLPIAELEAYMREHGIEPHCARQAALSEAEGGEK